MREIMDNFYSFSIYYLMTKAFLFCFMAAATFIGVIPQAYKAYLLWLKSNKDTHLSTALLLASLSLVLLGTTYPLFLAQALRWYQSTKETPMYWVLTGAVLLFFLYISVPNCLRSYRKLSEAKTAFRFTLFTFYATLSFYSLSFLYAPLIQAAFSLAQRY